MYHLKVASMTFMADRRLIVSILNSQVVEEIAQALHVLANLDVTAFQRKGLTSSNCHLLPYALLGTRAQSHESGQLIRSLPLSLSLLMDLSATSPMLAFLKDPAPAFFIKENQAQGTVQLQLHILLRFFTPGPTATHEYILSASSTSDQISKTQMEMVSYTSIYTMKASLTLWIVEPCCRKAACNSVTFF